jgi:hypothetical protein
MGSDLAVDAVRGLEWLVNARNNMQSLLLRLFQRWDSLSSTQRHTALGAAFSLWRAVFLLVRRAENESLDRADIAAKAFLERVTRTNAIGFADDLRNRSWTGAYYVENAMHRITELTGHESVVYRCSPMGTVRDAWKEAFDQLDALVGTIPRTTSLSDTPRDDRPTS